MKADAIQLSDFSEKDKERFWKNVDTNGRPPQSPSSAKLRFRLTAFDPETKREFDGGVMEVSSWREALEIAQWRYNYPRRVIPIPDGVVVFSPNAKLTCSAPSGGAIERKL